MVTGVQGILGQLSTRWSGLWSEEEGGEEVQDIERHLEDWHPNPAAGLGDLGRPVLGEEILKVLASTTLGMAPGEDGLPWDFWKRMASVGEVLEEMSLMCDAVISSGEWIGGQQLGLVSLLYKDKGCREDWKNWRPIMLLEMDRKLVTKVLVARLQGVAQQVIGKEQ